MTIATMPGTYLGNLGQPGDYIVQRPNDAWSGAGALVQVLTEYGDTSAGQGIWQRGRDVGAAAYTHERAGVHGSWSAWAVIGAGVTLPVPQTTAPVLTSIDPVAIDDDTASHDVTITGTGFVRGCTVEVDGSTANGATTFTDATTLVRAVLTAHATIVAAESVAVVVVNPDGKRSGSAILAIETP